MHIDYQDRFLTEVIEVEHPDVQCSVQPTGADEPDDRRALLVGGLQVHFYVDAPVMVARRVVQDLSNPPHVGLPVDDQQRWAAGIGGGAHVVVLGEVLIPELYPTVGGPARVGVELTEVVPAPPCEELHPPSRLESTWRTSSPSHSTMSVTSSGRAAAGTPDRSALNASER